MIKLVVFIALCANLAGSLLAHGADAVYKVGELNADSGRSHSNRAAAGQTQALLRELGAAGYFIARDGTDYDAKLWRTDGTTAGTTLVRRLLNNRSSGSKEVVAALKSGALLYYRVGDFLGAALFRSDGTPEGTYLLADGVTDMADVNGTLYFSTGTNTTNAANALYKTSGSQIGTVKVKSFAGGGPVSLVNAGGTLFFSSDDGSNGRELWKSDGTDTGTVMVRNIVQGSGSSKPTNLTSFGGRLAFVPETFPNQLWVSDGTEAGTTMLVDFAAVQNANTYPMHLADVNGTLIIFVGGGNYSNLKIYKSNGTAGTTVIADGGPFGLGLPTSKDDVTVVGDTLYFIAGDRAGSSSSYVYKTTGDVATQVSGQYINAQNPVGTGTFASAPILAVGTRVYFGNSTGNGESVEVCAIDHNVAGSERLVADINPLKTGTRPYDFAAYNSRLFFTEDNGTTGISPYLTDGTATMLLKDINATTLGSVISETAAAGGKLFFLKEEPSGFSTKHTLFHTAGTGFTAVAVDPLPLQMGGLSKLGESVTFVGTRPNSIDHSLYITDGSTPLKLKSSTIDSRIGGLFSGTQFFTVTFVKEMFSMGNFVTTDLQLWKTDGTVAGTVAVKSFTSKGRIRQILISNGVTFMVADDGTSGFELWRTDGTDAGTVLIKDIQTGNSIDISQVNGKATSLLAFSGGVYFKVSKTDGSQSIYKSDGTAAGTSEVLSKMNGLPNGGFLIGVSNNLLYYNANAVLNVYNGATSTQIHSVGGSELADVNGTAFFTAFDGETRLYKSDGTAAGTLQLLDYARNVRQLTSFAGQLFFTNSDFTPSGVMVHGNELWRSDGTPLGTFMVQDLFKGAPDGVSRILDQANGTLFLLGQNVVSDSELFATLATSTNGSRPSVMSQSVTGIVGKPLSVALQFSGSNSTLHSKEYASSRLVGYLPGVTFNIGTASFSGTPLEHGIFQFDISAQNETGHAAGKITFNISPPIGPRVGDIDGNNSYDALTDGLLVIRYLFGLTGDALVNGAVGNAQVGPPIKSQTTSNAASRSTPAEILQYLDAIKANLDIDGNGQSDALTDGLLVIRYLFGLRGNALISGAVAASATRKTAAEIETYLQSLMPQ